MRKNDNKKPHDKPLLKLQPALYGSPIVPVQRRCWRNGVCASNTTDIRQFNETGFRIQRNDYFWAFGDEQKQIRVGNAGQLMERLQKAWGLAFQECPGKKSAF
jgi:hypothetical protein